jgi:hypothetical protein
MPCQGPLGASLVTKYRALPENMIRVRRLGPYEDGEPNVGHSHNEGLVSGLFGPLQ